MAYGDNQRRVQWALPSPSRFFTPGVVTLLVLLVAGYIVASFVPPLAGAFVLSPTRVLHGQVWRLVTYPFINGCVSSLIMGMIGVLLIGSAIEREWRARSFLLLWLVVGVVCGLLWVAIGSIVSAFTGNEYVGAGTAACVYGLLGAFGLIYRRRRAMFLIGTFEMQYFVLILLAIGVIVSLRTPMNLIWITGAGVAYLYIKLLWRIRSGRSKKAAKEVGRFVEID